MRAIRSKGAVAAVAATVALVVVALGSGLGAGKSQVARAEAASQAAEAEAALAGTDIVPRMEAALGGAYGGAWFDPAIAQLRIGVTSAQSRQAAAAVAARAGVSEYVTETAVHSSRPQLVAAQEQWNRRLADLFAREEVVTGLQPQHNAVEVEVGPSVSASEREALEREAASSAIDVRVRASRQSLRLEPLARCVKFEAGKANCDPTIVAGTSIVSGSIGCTAGPAIVRKPAPDTTETLLLTAGHCIEDAGGIQKAWYAKNKLGEEKEIGTPVEFVTKNYDVGVIKIDKSSVWAEKTQTPVIPAYASWSNAVETEPVAVAQQEKPYLASKSCYSGSTSGTKCGEVVEENVKTKTLKDLYKINGITAQPGDSGAPVFWGELLPGRVQGLLVARVEGTAQPLFHSLTHAFENLGGTYELLTGANKERPKCPMKKGMCFLEAATYPIVAAGSGEELFGFGGWSFECEGKFETSSTTDFALYPFYTGCAAFGGIGATVDASGCHFTLEVVEESAADEFEAEADLACGEGSIDLTAITCEAKIGSQEGLGTVRLTSETGTGDVGIEWDLAGIVYTVTKDGFLCPFSGTGVKSGGTYSSVENLMLESEQEIWVAAP
jgi:streptogrisin C